MFRKYQLAIWLSMRNFYSRFTKVTRKCECFGRIVEPCIMIISYIRSQILETSDIYIYFNFKIINFPNMCSNIPASPAYGVYISQLIRYARGSSNYSDFLKRHLHLRNRLLDQGYKKIRLIRSLKKFIFRYQYLVEIYSVSAEKIISDAFSYSENV